MKFQFRRTARYYQLKFLRLKGDAESIARGAGLGIFIGITPTLPFHTILLLLLCPPLRGNLIAALLAATIVSNPLTFFFQYYFSWKLGNWLVPCNVSWESIQALLDYLTGDASFTQSIEAVLHLGKNTMITLLAGGVLLAAPSAVIVYFLTRATITKFRNKRLQKHILS